MVRNGTIEKEALSKKYKRRILDSATEESEQSSGESDSDYQTYRKWKRSHKAKTTKNRRRRDSNLSNVFLKVIKQTLGRYSTPLKSKAAGTTIVWRLRPSSFLLIVVSGNPIVVQDPD